MSMPFMEGVFNNPRNLRNLYIQTMATDHLLNAMILQVEQ